MLNYNFVIVKRKEKVKWIIGSDWLKKLDTFKNYEELKKTCEFIIIDRPGNLKVTALVQKPQIEFNLSSTIIRQRIKNNLPIRGLVPRNVEKFIKEHKIYGDKK